MFLLLGTLLVTLLGAFFGCASGDSRRSCNFDYALGGDSVLWFLINEKYPFWLLGCKNGEHHRANMLSYMINDYELMANMYKSFSHESTWLKKLLNSVVLTIIIFRRPTYMLSQYWISPMYTEPKSYQSYNEEMYPSQLDIFSSCKTMLPQRQNDT